MSAAAIVAAVPLIEPALKDIISLIAGLVHKQAPVADASLGVSNGTGSVKLADLYTSVTSAITTAISVGTLQGPMPPAQMIAAITQAAVVTMQQCGALGATATTTPATPQANTVAVPVGVQHNITLRVGETMNVTVTA